MRMGDTVPRGVMNRRKIDRRAFLKLGALATVAGFSPVSAFGAINRFALPVRSLSLYNTHTGEALDTDYCVRGRYFPEALQRIDHILRDHRTGEVVSIDPGVLDFLHAISRKLGTRGPFHIISGYRSPATNVKLHARSKNVATNSLHVRGKAVDIRLPGVHLRSLRRVALDLSRGGVGYYPKSDFVHVDVGRVRFW